MHKRNTHFEGVDLRRKGRCMTHKGTWKSREIFLSIFPFPSLTLVQSISEYKYVSYLGLEVGQRTKHKI